MERFDKVMKVAVIGAGVGGLAAVKSCLEEGLEPECFERKDGLGGVWNYLPTPVEGQPSVIWSTVSNSCKETYCYSDFPCPDDFPNFMHHTKVIEYLKLYAERFDLERYIRYRTEVIEISQTEDFKTTGQWTVKVKDIVTGECETRVFDAVLVCSGHHSEPLWPQFDGSREFEGRQMHSHEYRSTKGFEGQRVVVVGFANTAIDIAVELSHACSQVYLSARQRNWIFPRVFPDGVTIDYVLNRRFIGALPTFIRRRYVASVLNTIFDQSLYGVRPPEARSPEDQQPIINDMLHPLIASNRIILKPNIRTLTRTGAVFEDGTREEGIDAVVYATGYKNDMSFIKHRSYGVREETLVDLFRFVFAPDVDPPTMAIIGCVQPSNSVLPITEMQSRWAVAVFKGDRRLPSEDEMKKEIKKRREDILSRYVNCPRFTTNVDWIAYMDEIATEVDCKPDWVALLASGDPRLAISVFFGECIPSQYRLRGRGAWPKARQTVLENWNRTLKPFEIHQDTNRHGKRRSQQSPCTCGLLLGGGIVIVIAALILFYLL